MIEEVLAGLSPKTRKRFTTAANIEITRIPTASHGINVAVGGGLPSGRITTLYGNKSSGKSSLMLQTIARNQQDGVSCAYVDVERTYDASWASRLGVNNNELLYSNSTSMTHVVNELVDLLKTGIKFIVVDSITALAPATYFEDKGDELKPFENTGQIGSVARDLSAALRMINYANINTVIVLISQTRTNIGGLYATQTFTGGQAVKFYSSCIIKLFSSESDNKAIKQQIQTGDRIVEVSAGRDVDWNIEFSKIGPPGQRGSYPFYYRAGRYGIDEVSEIIQLADSLGLIERSGSWYTVPNNDKSIQGIPNVIEHYRTQPDELAILLKLVQNGSN